MAPRLNGKGSDDPGKGNALRKKAGSTIKRSSDGKQSHPDGDKERAA